MDDRASPTRRAQIDLGARPRGITPDPLTPEAIELREEPEISREEQQLNREIAAALEIGFLSAGEILNGARARIAVLDEYLKEATASLDAAKMRIAALQDEREALARACVASETETKVVARSDR
jgi:hypothetical protein